MDIRLQQITQRIIRTYGPVRSAATPTLGKPPTGCLHSQNMEYIGAQKLGHTTPREYIEEITAEGINTFWRYALPPGEVDYSWTSWIDHILIHDFSQVKAVEVSLSTGSFWMTVSDHRPLDLFLGIGMDGARQQLRCMLTWRLSSRSRSTSRASV